MAVLALSTAAAMIAPGRVDAGGEVRDARRVPTPASSVWDACRRLVLEIAAGEQVSSVGICSTGPVDMAAGIVAPDAPTRRDPGRTRPMAAMPR